MFKKLKKNIPTRPHAVSLPSPPIPAELLSHPHPSPQRSVSVPVPFPLLIGVPSMRPHPLCHWPIYASI